MRGSPAHAGMDPSKTHSFSVTIGLPEPSRKHRKARVRAPRPTKPPTPEPTKIPARKPPARKKRATANITLPTPEEKREARLEYERARNQLPERKRNNRDHSRQWIALARELGLCVSCHGIPIKDQTRCKTCAEKHREYRRRARERAARKRDQASGQGTMF